MTKLLNCQVKFIVATLVTISIFMLTVPLALGQEGVGEARVYAEPIDSPAGTVVVDVVAENVTKVYGAEFRLTYDPAVMAVQDFRPEQDGIQIEGGTLLPPNQGFVVANQVDERAGTVTFAMTLLSPAPPVTGSGPLARVTFKMLQDIPTTINVERAKLVAVDLQAIPSRTEAFVIGSSQQPASLPDVPGNETLLATAPADTARTTAIDEEEFPWWIVAAVIMILGILALGGFIVMDGLKSASRSKSTEQNRPDDR